MAGENTQYLDTSKWPSPMEALESAAKSVWKTQKPRPKGSITEEEKRRFLDSMVDLSLSFGMGITKKDFIKTAKRGYSSKRNPFRRANPADEALPRLAKAYPEKDLGPIKAMKIGKGEFAETARGEAALKEMKRAAMGPKDSGFSGPLDVLGYGDNPPRHTLLAINPSATTGDDAINTLLHELGHNKAQAFLLPDKAHKLFGSDPIQLQGDLWHMLKETMGETFDENVAADFIRNRAMQAFKYVRNPPELQANTYANLLKPLYKKTGRLSQAEVDDAFSTSMDVTTDLVKFMRDELQLRSEDPKRQKQQFERIFDTIKERGASGPYFDEAYKVLKKGKWPNPIPF